MGAITSIIKALGKAGSKPVAKPMSKVIGNTADKIYIYGGRVVIPLEETRMSGPIKMRKYFAKWTEEDNMEYKSLWGEPRPAADKGQYGWAPESVLKPVDEID